jgi:hypothetical protein
MSDLGRVGHKGADNVYPTIVNGGKTVLITNWLGIGT